MKKAGKFKISWPSEPYHNERIWVGNLVFSSIAKYVFIGYKRENFPWKHLLPKKESSLFFFDKFQGLLKFLGIFMCFIVNVTIFDNSQSYPNH